MACLRRRTSSPAPRSIRSGCCRTWRSHAPPAAPSRTTAPGWSSGRGSARWCGHAITYTRRPTRPASSGLAMHHPSAARHACCQAPSGMHACMPASTVPHQHKTLSTMEDAGWGVPDQAAHLGVPVHPDGVAVEAAVPGAQRGQLAQRHARLDVQQGRQAPRAACAPGCPPSPPLPPVQRRS